MPFIPDTAEKPAAATGRFIPDAPSGNEDPLTPAEQSDAEHISDIATAGKLTRPEQLSGNVASFLDATETLIASLHRPIAQVRKGVAGIATNLGFFTPDEFQEKVESIDHPAPLIPSVPEQEGTTAKIGAGVANGIIDFVNGMADPDAAMQLGIAGVPSAGRKALLTLFAVSMAKEAPDQFEAGVEAVRSGDTQEAARHFTGGAGSTILPILMAKHANTPALPSLPDRAAKSEMLAKALDASDLKVPSETGTVPIPREAGPLRPGDVFKSELPNVSPELQALAPQTAAVVTRATELPKVEAAIEEPPLFISSPSAGGPSESVNLGDIRTPDPIQDVKNPGLSSGAEKGAELLHEYERSGTLNGALKRILVTAISDATKGGTHQTSGPAYNILVSHIKRDLGIAIRPLLGKTKASLSFQKADEPVKINVSHRSYAEVEKLLLEAQSEAEKVQVPAKPISPDEKTESEPAKPVGLDQLPSPAETPAGPEAVLPDRPAPKEAPVETQAEVKPPEMTGMGAAVPGEFAPARQTATGIKNAAVDAERQARGQAPMTAPQRLANPVVWDRTMAKIDNDPGWQDRLIDELKERPRTPNQDEIVALDHRYVDLQNEYAKATRDGAKAYEDGHTQGVEEASARALFFEKKLSELEQVARTVGTEWGRSGQMRQRLLKEDFTLAAMEAKARASRGFEPLTEGEHAEIVELQKQLAAKDQLAIEAKAASDAKYTALEIEKALAEARAAGPAYEPRVLVAAEKFAKFMDKKGDDALARIKARLGRTSAGVDPTILSDVGILGAAKLTRGIVDFAKWTDAMTRDLGEWFREHAQEAWDASQKVFASENENFHKGVDKATKEKVKRATDLPGRIDNAKESIKSKAAKGEGSPIHSEVRKLVRLLVEQNPKITRESLIDTVHAILTESMPEITRLEAMDAISGRGKFWTPAQDEVSKTVRDLGTQIRLVGHQIDVEAGRPIPRTGYQPEKMTDAARREQQILNDLKRRHGVVVTDPAAQLGSALAARKTYYTHRIADLKNEISTRERIVKNRSLPPTDPALEALKVEYEKVKADHAEIFTKPGLTDAQRLKLAIAAAERNEASWTERLAQAKKGNFSTGSTARKITSPELEAIKARAELAKEEVAELRDADSIITESGQRKALETSIAEYERKLKAGEFAPEGPRSGPDTEAVTALKKKRADLASRLAELRAASPEAKAEAARKAYDAAKAANEELARRINEGDIAARQKPGPPVTDPALAALRAETADLTKMLRELQNASKPRKTPEQIALQSLKTRLATEKADLQDRIAKGDFSPRRKNREMPLDREAAAAKAEVILLREQFQRGLDKSNYDRKSRLEKTWIGTKESLNISRALLTSWDVSAVFRQGGFIVLGNPARAARNLKPMFEALASNKRAIAIEAEIASRPNAKLYAQSKLFLAPREGSRLSGMEEAFMSRLAAKIPGVGASGRAYITFLNKLRADSFDALHESLAAGKEATPAELQAIANYINIATGRGNLAKFAPAAEVLATTFFAPRLVASRFQLLAGAPLYKGSARTRYLIAKEYAKFLTGLGVVYTLGQLAGADVETDPRSSDFGKLKFGNTRVDPLSGLAQTTVLSARVLSGKRVDSKGRLKSIRGEVKFGDPDTAGVLGQFLRTKLSPVLGTAVDIVTGENVVGEPVTPGSVAQNTLTPLAMRDIYAVMTEQGIPAGTAISLLSLFGMSVQNYEPGKK